MKSLRRQKRSDKRRRTRRRPLPAAQRGGENERRINCILNNVQDLINFYNNYLTSSNKRGNIKNDGTDDCNIFDFDYSKSVFNPDANYEDIELPFFVDFEYEDKSGREFYIKYINIDRLNKIIPSDIIFITCKIFKFYIFKFFRNKNINDTKYRLSPLYDELCTIDNDIFNAFLSCAILRYNNYYGKNIEFRYVTDDDKKREFVENITNRISLKLPPPPQETFLPPAPPAPAPAQINTEKQLSEMAEKIDKLTETVEVLTKETEKNNENISNIGEVIKQTVLEPAPAPAPEPAPIIPDATANIPPPPPPPPTTQLTATTPIPIIPVTSPPAPPPPSQIIAPENGEYQYMITINNNTIGIQPNTIQLPDGTYIIRVTLAGNNISGQILQVVNAPKAPANIPLELEPGEYAFTVQNKVISTQTKPGVPDGSSYTINITIADNELGRKSITGQIEEGPPPPPTPAL